MVCPNCGAEQPESFECIHCGIVFAKYAAAKQRPREHTRSSWGRQLGTTTRIIRALVGLVCLFLAVLMYLNGTALKAFGPYIALVFFAAAGLYFLLSIFERIPTWRFAVEAAVTGVVGAMFFALLPDVFSLSKPLYESTITPSPTNEVRNYLNIVTAKIIGINKFLDTSEVPSVDDSVQLIAPLSLDQIREAFERVPEKDRDLIAAIHARILGLSPLLEALKKQAPVELPNGPRKWVPLGVSLDLQRNLEAIVAMIRMVSSRLDEQASRATAQRATQEGD